jgi:hypothetical protein
MLYEIETLTRSRSAVTTLSHPMGEGRGEGIRVNPCPSVVERDLK